MSVDVNSADWHDGFETASAESCFNERQEIQRLRKGLERIANLKPQPALDRYDTQKRCRVIARKTLNGEAPYDHA